MSSSTADGSTGSDRQVKFSTSKSMMGKFLGRSCSTASATLSDPTSLVAPTRSALSATDRSFTITDKPLDNIPEHGKDDLRGASGQTTDDTVAAAKAKRATMVKKAIRYFEDKSNRSVSEDNLFTRRKNLAVHLGLDEKVGMREVQKINTYSLPVPSSATPFSPHQTSASAAREIVVVDEEPEDLDEDEDLKTKDLVRFLGMKDGITASMASQGRLSDDLLLPPDVAMAHCSRSASLGATPSPAQLAQIKEEAAAAVDSTTSLNKDKSPTKQS